MLSAEREAPNKQQKATNSAKANFAPAFLTKCKTREHPRHRRRRRRKPRGLGAGEAHGRKAGEHPRGIPAGRGGSKQKKNKIPAGRGAPSSGSCCPPAARPRRTEPARARGPAPRMSEVNQGGSGHLCYHSLVRLLANQSSWQCKRQEKCSGQ